MSAETKRVRPEPPRKGKRPLVGLAASREGARLAAAVLEVLGGARTPPQAAEALGVSLAHYYNLERRSLGGLVAACEPRPRGRSTPPGRRIEELSRENARLASDNRRLMALLRASQRAVGLAPPPSGSSRATDGARKRRKRKPTVRALRMAQAIRAVSSGDESATLAVPSTSLESVAPGRRTGGTRTPEPGAEAGGGPGGA